MKASMYIYPWDILDYGMERCMEKLASLGMDQFSVAVNYHTAKLLLPHNPERTVYFTEPGLLYFRPREESYPGPLEPAESSLTAGTDFLGELVEKAAAAGLEVIAWVVCMHNTRLGFMHPETTVLTATGDRLLHSFCPVNPAAQEYVKGMVSDLASRFALKAVELESAAFMGFLHGYHHEISGMDIPSSLDFLLSLCFCPHCTESAGGAGIDMEELRGKVNEYIRKELEKPVLPRSPRELPDMIPGLDEFIDWRVDVVTSFVDSVKRESCPQLELITIATVFPPNSDARLLNGADPVELSRVCDSVAVSGYFAEPEELKEDLETLSSLGITFERFRAGLRPQAPDSYGYDNFVAKLRLLSDRSFGAVSFYNFGTMRASSFEWIRRGLEETEK